MRGATAFGRPGPSWSGRVQAALAAALLLLPARSLEPGPRPAGQATEPRSVGDSVVIGGRSMYDGRYGQAEFRDLDDEPRPWPRQHATRTVGRFFEARAGGVGKTVEWTNPISTHVVCGRRYCLALTPAEEVAHAFSGATSSWVGQRVEVIGAIDDLNKDPRREPLWAFLVWSFTLAESQGRDDRGAPAVSELEALVTSPEAQAGGRISVKGVFRGANLFGDMPAGSQREPGDWVLKDGPFFIWVTGKRPKGKGFDLDPSSRSDCRWRLEVSGKVEEEDGLVYLEAKDVRLLGRAPEEPGAP